MKKWLLSICWSLTSIKCSATYSIKASFTCTPASITVARAAVNRPPALHDQNGWADATVCESPSRWESYANTGPRHVSGRIRGSDDCSGAGIQTDRHCFSLRVSHDLSRARTVNSGLVPSMFELLSFCRNEREVGRAIRGSGVPREDIFVVTKVRKCVPS